MKLQNCDSRKDNSRKGAMGMGSLNKDNLDMGNSRKTKAKGATFAKSCAAIAAIVAISIFALALLAGCGSSSKKGNSNPCEADFVNTDLKTMLNTITRVDTDGYLYEIDYTYDYYSEDVYGSMSLMFEYNSGCSAFTTYNTDGDFIMARNYDYKHEDAEGNTTGQNLVVKTAPEGKLKSIAICDTYWLNPKGYYKGSLDDGKTDLSNVVLAPYMCVDGINEAGVSAALLALDTKPGEVCVNQNTGKEARILSVLLRYILDDAHSLEEAIAIAQSYDIIPLSPQDMHIVIADKDGNSAVLEWRQYGGDTAHKLYVTYTNAVTNFFVGFDDGQDTYREDGSLREKLSKVTNTVNTYKYGYGHGYHRFNGIVTAMDRYIAEDTVANKHGVKNATMMETQAVKILSVAEQEPGLEKTSLTQYGALFNMGKGTVTLYSQRDYTKSYSFSMN